MRYHRYCFLYENTQVKVSFYFIFWYRIIQLNDHCKHCHLCQDYLYLSDTTVAIFMASSGLGSMIIAFIYLILMRKWSINILRNSASFVLALSMFFMSYEPLFICFDHVVHNWNRTIAFTNSSGKIVNASSNPSDRTAFYAQFSLSHLSWFFGYLLAGELGFMFGFSFTASIFYDCDGLFVVQSIILAK